MTTKTALKALSQGNREYAAKLALMRKELRNLHAATEQAVCESLSAATGFTWTPYGTGWDLSVGNGIAASTVLPDARTRSGIRVVVHAGVERSSIELEGWSLRGDYFRVEGFVRPTAEEAVSTLPALLQKAETWVR